MDKSSIFDYIKKVPGQGMPGTQGLQQIPNTKKGIETEIKKLDNVEKQIGNLMVLITNMSTGVNSRLDNIVNMMTKVRGAEHDN